MGSTMILNGTRFGTIEIEDDRVLTFATGIIGFPNETRFALLEREPPRPVAWLQSLTTPALALPVIDGTALGASYFAEVMAASTGTIHISDDGDHCESTSCADHDRDNGHETLTPENEPFVFVVVAAPKGGPLVANMVAPIVVDVATKNGRQIVLDPRRFGAQEPLVMPKAPATKKSRARRFSMRAPAR